MQARILSLFLIVAFAFSGAQLVQAQPFVLGGSDLLGDAVGEELAESLAEAGLQVKLNFAGSLAAEDQLADGRLDAAIVARRDDTPMEGETARFPLAFQVAVFAVHPDNPVSGLNTEQLAAMFRDREPLDSWSELTTDEEWGNRKISPLVARMSNAMGLEIFNAFVLEGERLNRNVRIFEEEAAVLAAQLADPSFVTLVPWNEDSGNWKYLAVSEPGGQGFTPSDDNIFFGDYFLRLPFHLVISERVFEDQLEALLTVLYAEEMEEGLRAGSFVPIPETERQSILLGLE